MSIVWCFNFLFNLNSCNFQKNLIFHEMSISFNIVFVNSEKFVLLFVNEIERD